MTDRYCVFGHPVAHSKSPFIHAAFAEQTADTIEYTAIEAPRDDFPGAWQRFTAEGGRGANVTVPFKEEAFRLCDTLSERARRAGAVNTLSLAGDGRTHGDTTDGIGLVRDLERHGVALAGARILVLGAGGAVRGILEPLLARHPASLLVANRTAARAEALAADFRDLGEIAGGGFDRVEGPFDLVINGTSASLAGDLPPLPDGLFAAGATAHDMMYGAEPTLFLRWAGERGARTVDGLGMLVEQAAES
ncbi:MAG TPA: shikimate dehydrogenase, partial [Halomonas sp.]|nr:shikimate dehydrogenase [Halomonas sp.]